MGRRATAEKRAEWSARVERWRASGLSAQAFSKREGVSTTSLFAWSRRLQATVGPGFARVVPTPSRAPHKTAERALVVAVGRARIQVEGGFDAVLLRDVVRVLSELAS